MRREPAIGIDFVRRERQHGALGAAASDRPSSAAAKKRTSAISCSTSASVGTTTSTGDRRAAADSAKRHRRRRQPGRGAAGRGPSPARRWRLRAARDSDSDDAAESDHQRHHPPPASARRCAMSNSPARPAIRTTRPPRASTVSRPTIASPAQSAPFTSTSGCRAPDDGGRRLFVEDHDGVDAVERGQQLGALVLRRESGAIGPLLTLHRASELSADDQRVALRRARPAGSGRGRDGARSKTPFVKTTRRPAARCAATPARRLRDRQHGRRA